MKLTFLARVVLDCTSLNSIRVNVIMLSTSQFHTPKNTPSCSPKSVYVPVDISQNSPGLRLLLH